MKNLIVIALMITLCSCIASTPLVRTSSFIDFTKYNEIYLSQSTTADFRYKPIGIVESYCKSGYDNGNSKQQGTINNDAVFSAGSGKMKYKAFTAQDAMDLLCLRAKEMNATGILNIKIDYIPDLGQNSFLYFGYSASGMAIKNE